MSKLAEKMLDTLTQVYWMTGEHDAAIAIIDAALKTQRETCAKSAQLAVSDPTVRWKASEVYRMVKNAEVEELYVDPLDGTRRVDAPGERL